MVGAGITGLSSAYHLKKNNSDLRLAVIDRMGSYAQGNTGRATAAFRDLYSSDVNFKLASSSTSFYRYAQDTLHHNMGMHYVGYLFLLTQRQLELAVFEKMRKRTGSRLLDRDEITALSGLRQIPAGEDAKLLALEEISGAFYGANCGIFEPDLVCSYYYSELEKMGVEFHFNTEATSLSLVPVSPLNYPGEPFVWQNKKIGGITTTNGEFSADQFVLANDVWVNSLLDPIGIDSHMRPQKRQVFQVSSRDLETMLHSSGLNEESIFPFTILPKSGIHFRPSPSERSFRVSGDEEIGRDFSIVDDPLPEPDFYNYSLKPVVQAYFPAFGNASVNGMWAGYYSYNTIDAHPFIFKELNLIVATGTSGSGLMKGDAIGRVVESLYSDRTTTKLFNGKELETSCLGVTQRNVPKEEFVL